MNSCETSLVDDEEFQAFQNDEQLRECVAAHTDALAGAIADLIESRHNVNNRGMHGARILAFGTVHRKDMIVRHKLNKAQASILKS